MISLTLLGLGLVAVVFYINFGEKFVFGFLTIFDFFIKGKFDNSTSLILKESFPPYLSFMDWLIGTGNFSLETVDSGYIRLITGGGFLGLLISYSFMFVPLIFAIKRGLDYGLLVLLAVFPIIVLVINFKNIFYFAYNDIFQIYTLIVISVFKLDPISSISASRLSLNSKNFGS